LLICQFNCLGGFILLNDSLYNENVEEKRCGFEHQVLPLVLPLGLKLFSAERRTS